MSYKIKCTCKHEFQDKTYGSGVRVATPTVKVSADKSNRDVRCTVCGKIHTTKNQ